MPRDWSWIRDGWARRRVPLAPAGKLVRIAAVIAAVAGVPWFGAGAMADAGGRGAAAPLQFAAGSADFEAELWSYVKDGGNADDLDAFLAIFPDGKFAGRAKDRLARLRGDAPAAEQPKPPLPSLKIAPIRVAPMRARRAARTNARVRARPDTSSATITIIPRGQVLDVTGTVEKSDWVRAELPGGRRGYIYGPLLGPVPVPKPVSKPISQPAENPAPKRRPVPTPEAPKSAAVSPTQSAAPASAADLAARRAEIVARWDQKIGLIKRTGQHTECYSAGGGVDMDSTEFMDCSDREATIARLEAAKQEELAELPAAARGR